jgi:hypothetical protein
VCTAGVQTVRIGRVSLVFANFDDWDGALLVETIHLGFLLAARRVGKHVIDSHADILHIGYGAAGVTI